MFDYEFDIKIDRGAQGNCVRTFHRRDEYYENALDSVYDELYKEFANEVAFFSVEDYRVKRVA